MSAVNCLPSKMKIPMQSQLYAAGPDLEIWTSQKTFSSRNLSSLLRAGTVLFRLRKKHFSQVPTQKIWPRCHGSSRNQKAWRLRSPRIPQNESEKTDHQDVPRLSLATGIHT